MSNPLVVTRGLTKTYADEAGDVVAVDGVDVSIASGEFVAIMGPSGCGKSTLLHLLAGLARPTSGDVVVDGVSLASLGDDALAELRRDHIGTVFQAFNLVQVLSAVENVALPARLQGQPAKAATALALEQLARVGLEDKQSRKPAQLSGGEQQRVAIARALVLTPALLLADEPTGNLDTVATRTVIDLLRDVNEGGQTVVVVTHDPKVASYAHRVLAMRDGRIVRETNLDRPGDVLLLTRLIDSRP